MEFTKKKIVNIKQLLLLVVLLFDTQTNESIQNVLEFVLFCSVLFIIFVVVVLNAVIALLSLCSSLACKANRNGVCL